MIQLRLLTVVVLAAVSCGLGAACAAFKYEQKITRITEDREGYMALADKALATSDRALTFATGYQETLDICMTRLYAPTTTAVVVSKTPFNGGIGGPLDVRKPSRLP
jgi:hypothetical protein